MQKEKLVKIGLIIIVFLLSVCLLNILLSEKKEEFDVSHKDNKVLTDEQVEKMMFDLLKGEKKSNSS